MASSSPSSFSSSPSSSSSSSDKRKNPNAVDQPPRKMQRHITTRLSTATAAVNVLGEYEWLHIMTFLDPKSIVKLAGTNRFLNGITSRYLQHSLKNLNFIHDLSPSTSSSLLWKVLLDKMAAPHPKQSPCQRQHQYHLESVTFFRCTSEELKLFKYFLKRGFHTDHLTFAKLYEKLPLNFYSAALMPDQTPEKCVVLLMLMWLARSKIVATIKSLKYPTFGDVKYPYSSLFDKLTRIEVLEMNMNSVFEELAHFNRYLTGGLPVHTLNLNSQDGGCVRIFDLHTGGFPYYVKNLQILGRVLHRLPNLRHLNLGFIINDQTMTSIAENCPNLETLTAGIGFIKFAVFNNLREFTEHISSYNWETTLDFTHIQKTIKSVTIFLNTKIRLYGAKLENLTYKLSVDECWSWGPLMSSDPGLSYKNLNYKATVVTFESIETFSSLPPALVDTLKHNPMLKTININRLVAINPFGRQQFIQFLEQIFSLIHPSSPPSPINLVIGNAKEWTMIEYLPKDLHCKLHLKIFIGSREL